MRPSRLGERDRHNIGDFIQVGASFSLLVLIVAVLLAPILLPPTPLAHPASPSP